MFKTLGKTSSGGNYLMDMRKTLRKTQQTPVEVKVTTPASSIGSSISSKLNVSRNRVDSIKKKTE